MPSSQFLSTVLQHDGRAGSRSAGISKPRVFEEYSDLRGQAGPRLLRTLRTRNRRGMVKGNHA